MDKIGTEIRCDIVTCDNRNSLGFCVQKTIHLQGCTPEADNVVACSEFYETKEVVCAEENCCEDCVHCNIPCEGLTFEPVKKCEDCKHIGNTKNICTVCSLKSKFEAK